MGIGEKMFPIIGTFLFIAIFSTYGKANVNVNVNSKEGGPEWVDLECERGYKYLFSDLEVTWQDAIAECTLYGGHLVDVTSQQEHNCLVRYGRSKGLNTWYWIDANDQASKGTWVHASTAKDVEWFNPKWSCWTDGHFGEATGDAMDMNIGDERYPIGAWCNPPSSQIHKFICKARMAPDV